MFTFGLEIETAALPQSLWEDVSPWKVVTDGSIRTIQTFLSPVEKSENFYHRRSQERFGAELVSPVFGVNSYSIKSVKEVFSLLRGSLEKSRANMAIHIHVGHKELTVKKLADAWFFLQEVDKIFFNVSAPGEQKPRGVFNEFIYYRPLISPQWAVDRNVYRPSIGQVNRCKSLGELEYCLGRKDKQARKWYPARYCGINLVPFITQRTIEFRHFNFVSDWRYFFGWLAVSLAAVHRVIKKNFNSCDVDALLWEGRKIMKIPQEWVRMDEKDTWNMIDFSPVLSHTGERIYWESDHPFFGELAPKKSMVKIPRRVGDFHPVDVLDGADYPVFRF